MFHVSVPRRAGRFAARQWRQGTANTSGKRATAARTGAPAPAPAVDRGNLVLGAVFLAVVLGIPALILASAVLHAAVAVFGGAALMAGAIVAVAAVAAVAAGGAVRRGWQAANGE